MSRKIISTYNSDPSAGNDPSVNYKTAATDDTTSIALDMDQLSNAVAVRIGTSPPPEPSENLSQLVITILDNTLTATIQAITGVDYTHYAKQVDDLTTPTYPDDFAQGPVPTLHSLAADPDNPVAGDWVSEDVSIWVYDLPTAKLKQMLTPLDEEFVTVTPNDTIGPTGLSISAVGAVVTLTEATDAGIGLATTPYKIYVDGALHIDNIVQGSLTHTIDKPAGDYTVYYSASDANGNTTDSNGITVTIAAGGIGTVGFTSTLHEFTEDVAATYDVELSRTGTGSFDVDVTVIEDTAVDTTTDAVNGQFVRQVSDTISFVGAAPTANATITLNDVSALDINQAFMVIDFDQTGLNGALVTEESTRLLIEGSGATGDEGYQMTTSAPYHVTAEAEHYDVIRNSIKSGQTDDTWGIITTWNTRAVGDLGDDGTVVSGASSGNDYGSVTVLDIEAPYVDHLYAIPNAAVVASTTFDWFARCVKTPNNGWYHMSVVRSVASISVDGAGLATVTLDKKHGGFAGTETIYFEDLEGADSAEYNVVAGLTPNAAAAGLTFTISGMTASGVITSGTGNLLGADQELLGCRDDAYITVNPNCAWEWQNNAGNQQSFYVGEAGTVRLRTYMQENAHRWDRGTIGNRANGWNGSTTNVNIDDGIIFNPASIDEEGGYQESTYEVGSTGTPVPDENNLPNLWKPLPTATVSLTNDHVTPDFGATGVGVTTKVIIDLTGMTDLYINDLRVLEPNLTRRPDTSYSVAGMVITLDPGIMTAGVFYTVEIDARVRDTDGVVKKIVFTTDPYRFKTQTAGSAIFEQDFSSTVMPTGLTWRKFTLQEAMDLFEAPYLTNSNSALTITSGQARLSVDPFNSGRGNCLEIAYTAGQCGPLGTFDFYRPPYFSAYPELWFGFDVGFSDNWISMNNNHALVFKSFNFSPDRNPQGSGELACFWNLWGNNDSIPSGVVRLGKVDNHHGIYFYHNTCNQRNWYARVDNPDFNSIACEPCCQAPKPGAVYAQYQPGRWHRIVIHVKLNTTGTNDATANGICEVTQDGVPIITKTNVPWIDVPGGSTRKWDLIGFEHFVNCQSPVARNMSMYYDRLFVSDTAIT